MNKLEIERKNRFNKIKFKNTNNPFREIINRYLFLNKYVHFFNRIISGITAKYIHIYTLFFDSGKIIFLHLT